MSMKNQYDWEMLQQEDGEGKREERADPETQLVQGNGEDDEYE